MKILNMTAAAGILSANLASLAVAGSGVLRSAGFEMETAVMPEVSAPSAGEPAQGGPQDLDLFSYFGYGQKTRAAEISMQKEVGGLEKASLFSVNLESIKNVYLKPAITFATRAGTKVHVSGTKASNCPDGDDSCKEQEKFFLVLTTDKNESYFVRAMEIVNWSIFKTGSKTVIIDGEKYVLKIHADASDPEDSVLKIKGPRGVALKTTFKQIGDAVAAKGVDIKLGKSYKLAYGNEIVQGPKGAWFTSKMLVLIMPYPVVDAAPYFIFNASDIRPAGVVFPSFEKGYGFRLEKGMLEIYRI